MKESVALEMLAKMRKQNENKNCQKLVDAENKLWKDLQRDITMWDITQPRLEKEKQAKLNAKSKIKITVDDFEMFNGLKSSNYSEDNWERIKEGKPLKLLSIFMPRRLNARNSTELWDRKIYIAKKTADFLESKLFHAYDLTTGVFLASHRDKKKLIYFCKNKILKHEEDIEDAR